MNPAINLQKHSTVRQSLVNTARPRYPELSSTPLSRSRGSMPALRCWKLALAPAEAAWPMARRGYAVTAIELGGELAEVARRALRDYPNVRVLTGAFEDVVLPPGSFDLIYAATAFHWIRPESQFTKTHALLARGGLYTGIIGTNHVSDDRGEQFFVASQPIYERHDPQEKQDEAFRHLAPPTLNPTYWIPIDLSSLSSAYSHYPFLCPNVCGPSPNFLWNDRDGTRYTRSVLARHCGSHHR